MQRRTTLMAFCGLIVPFLLLSSCKKQTKECVSFTTAQVTHVSGPDTLMVNQEAEYAIQYYLNNGCGHFEGLESTTLGNIITISLAAKYQGCICTAVILNGEDKYIFKPSTTGTYYLKFVQPDKTNLIDTIIVR